MAHPRPPGFLFLGGVSSCSSSTESCLSPTISNSVALVVRLLRPQAERGHGGERVSGEAVGLGLTDDTTGDFHEVSGKVGLRLAVVVDLHDVALVGVHRRRSRRGRCAAISRPEAPQTHRSVFRAPASALMAAAHRLAAPRQASKDSRYVCDLTSEPPHRSGREVDRPISQPRFKLGSS